MGTSVSQPSPRTAGWNAVAACYSDPAVPVERAATEIWRAAVKQDTTIPDQLLSPLVDACLAISEKASTPIEAAQAIHVAGRANNNSLIGELAKRAAIAKAAGGFRNESATAVLFRHITDYLVSRDIAGYVGPAYRCKNIQDIRTFKRSIADVVSARVSQIEHDKRSGRDWTTSSVAILNHLQK